MEVMEILYDSGCCPVDMCVLVCVRKCPICGERIGALASCWRYFWTTRRMGGYSWVRVKRRCNLEYVAEISLRELLLGMMRCCKSLMRSK